MPDPRGTLPNMVREFSMTFALMRLGKGFKTYHKLTKHCNKKNLIP